MKLLFGNVNAMVYFNGSPSERFRVERELGKGAPLPVLLPYSRRGPHSFNYQGRVRR